MFYLIKGYRRDERGASAVEYAMLLVFVCLAVAIGAQALGTDIQNLFTSIGSTLNVTTPFSLPQVPTP